MIQPRTGMVLAAGLGLRMRPLTERAPKPLLRVAGRSLLDHALDRLAASGVERAVVNAHHLAPQVIAAVGGRERPRCEVVVEETLLDTGGGVLNALPRLGDGPFPVINGDAYWLDGPTPALRRLFGAWDEAEMDALLLLVRTAQVENETGRGDMFLDPLGRVRRPSEREVAPYLYAGVQVLSPRLLDAASIGASIGAPVGAPAGAWSMNRAWDRAIEGGRLFGLVHDGAWFHLSTPPDLEATERRLERGLARFF